MPRSDRTPKARIGVYDCWSCKKEVPVKKTEGGKLSAPCPWCDFPHYANESTEHHANLMKCVRLDVAPAANDPAKPAAKPAAASSSSAAAPRAKMPWEA